MTSYDNLSDLCLRFCFLSASTEKILISLYDLKGTERGGGGRKRRGGGECKEWGEHVREGCGKPEKSGAGGNMKDIGGGGSMKRVGPEET